MSNNVSITTVLDFRGAHHAKSPRIRGTKGTALPLYESYKRLKWRFILVRRHYGLIYTDRWCNFHYSGRFIACNTH